jgi:hypothetical protein
MIHARAPRQIRIAAADRRPRGECKIPGRASCIHHHFAADRHRGLSVRFEARRHVRQRAHPDLRDHDSRGVPSADLPSRGARRYEFDLRLHAQLRHLRGVHDGVRSGIYLDPHAGDAAAVRRLWRGAGSVAGLHTARRGDLPLSARADQIQSRPRRSAYHLHGNPYRLRGVFLSLAHPRLSGLHPAALHQAPRQDRARHLPPALRRIHVASGQQGTHARVRIHSCNSLDLRAGAPHSYSSS